MDWARSLGDIVLQPASDEHRLQDVMIGTRAKPGFACLGDTM